MPVGHEAKIEKSTLPPIGSAAGLCKPITQKARIART